MLGEILTWLGVAGAAVFAWGLYVFGGGQAERRDVKAEDKSEE